MTGPRYVVGVGMSNHDRAACLLADGQLVAAVAEERLDRRKRSEGYYRQTPRGVVLPPLASITRLLRDHELQLDDIELFACGRSLGACRETLISYLPVDPSRVVEPSTPSHHLAHAYSAFGTSPFSDAAVLVIDEQGHHFDGHYEKASWFTAERGPLQPLAQFLGSDIQLSLGMLYNVVAALVSLAEGGRPAAGKLMALAGYGNRPNHWPEVVECLPSGDFNLPLARVDEFLKSVGLEPLHNHQSGDVGGLDDLLAKYAPISWRSPLAADLARWAQDEISRGILHLATSLRSSTTYDTLAYAGGVALNCTANAQLRDLGWRDVFVHPAATDDGTAIGLALWGWVSVLGQNWPDRARKFDPFTGPTHRSSATDEALDHFGLASCRIVDGEAAVSTAARRVTDGQVVCWFAGRSEWGPRALGNRSIIASISEDGIKQRINERIKHREHFRPLGISGLEADLRQIGQVDEAPASLLPYMLVAIPAITDQFPEIVHVDGSVRVQVVDEAMQPTFARLLNSIGDATGMAVAINTSFNTLGEPLVEAPHDAVKQFLVSTADALYIEGRLILRNEIDEKQLELAMRKALSESDLDPIQRTQKLLDAGYAEQAAALLAIDGYAVDRAKQLRPAAQRRLHSVQMRLALASGDTEAATEHATEVLRWSSLSADANAATAVLASSSDAIAQQIAETTASLSGVGAVLRMATAIVRGDALE